MTLEELLKKVDFPDLVQPFINIIPNAKENLFSLKEAFDLLRMMKAGKSDGEGIKVFMAKYICDSPTQLLASIGNQKDWDIMLAREIIVDENCVASCPEIAAVILWTIRDDGFSPEEYNKYINGIWCIWPEPAHTVDNPYRLSYQKLSQRYCDLNWSFICEETDIPHVVNIYKKENWDPRRNGPKRHRDKRLLQRIEILLEKQIRWDLVERLMPKYSPGNPMKERIRKEIVNGPDFNHYYMISRCNAGGDVKYLTDLITQYFPEKQGSKSMIFCTAPSHIIRQQDLTPIWQSFRIPKPSIICNEDDNRDNVRVDLLVFV